MERGLCCLWWHTVEHVEKKSMDKQKYGLVMVQCDAQVQSMLTC